MPSISRSRWPAAGSWLWLSATLICLASFLTTAEAVSMPVPWTFSDPKNDPFNPLRYIANNVLTSIAISLVLVVALTQTWLFSKYGGRCMLAMLIGEYTWAIGFGVRLGLHSDPDSRGLYIAYYLFIVLSPCAFIASEYMLLGRIAQCISSSQDHLLIPARRITVVFVASDITTFLIQVAGASLSISTKLNIAKTGAHIFLAGLALQMASFFFFMMVALHFFYRVKTKEHNAWSMDAHKAWHQDRRVLFKVLLISSVGIFIRCTYRVAELAQGFHGHLATTEVYFYALDSLPLWISVAVYTPFWPARMLPTIGKGRVNDHSKEESSGRCEEARE